jgi:hypothetical protein
MTGPHESYRRTRPISVAELLAKNGTIGAPPVGGHRRRRRGNNDSVSVAELTGEIPIVPPAAEHDAADPATDQLEEVRDDYTGPLPGNGVAEHVEDEEDEEAELAEDHDAEPRFLDHDPRRAHYSPVQRRYQASAGVGAEQMSPDPVDIDDDDAVAAVAADLNLTRPALAATTPRRAARDADELPSYLRSTDGTLFGGETVADDLARRGSSRYDDLDVEHDEDDLDFDDESTMSPLARNSLVIGQCLLAVLFGAGLFIGFDQLWKWNNIVALVLSVLVILGLVVGVRVVRKTEDIGSTLIAVAVGALVTLGPLALLQSG